MAIAAYAAMAAGTAIEGKTAYDASKSEEALSQYNAAVARTGAEATARAGAEEAAMMREKMRRTLARNRALVGASGAQMTGSPYQVQLGVIDEFAADIGTTEFNTRIEASQKIARARAFELQAEAAKKSRKLGVGAALVGGVSNIAKFKLTQDLIK